MPAGMFLALLASRKEAFYLERVKRRKLRDAFDPTDIPDSCFIALYRLNREAFSDVLREVGPYIKKGSIPVKLQLAATLRHLAVGSFQGVIANDLNIGIARTTMCKLLWQVIKVLEDKLCPKWINLEMSENEMQSSKMHFYEKFGLPGVIGCVDGTHIRIIKAPLDASLYYNRKGYFSINAMIICDYQMRIRAIEAGRPGSSHDSFIWNLSEAKIFFTSQRRNGMRNSWLLGDSGYPLESFLMTPFKDPQPGTHQHRFNIAHTSARNIVERTIGNLKSRFRCLQNSAIQYVPQKVVKLVNVCCALHNICKHYNLRYEDILVDNEPPDQEDDIYSEENDDLPNSAESRTIRDNIALSLS